MNIYVGNLAYQLREDDLRNLFEQYGNVDSVRIITDPRGRSKGFGFVEMTEETDAQTAIEALNGTDMQGRTVVVNEARPREERSRTGGDYPRRNGGGFNRDNNRRSGGGFNRDNNRRSGGGNRY